MLGGMGKDQPPKLPIIDAEFEVIEDEPRTPQKAWIVRQLEKVPLGAWVALALAFTAWAKGAGYY